VLQMQVSERLGRFWCIWCNEVASGLDTPLLLTFDFNALIQELGIAIDSPLGRLLWELINDSQSVTWQNIQSAGATGWVTVQATADGSWVVIDVLRLLTGLT
jgi:hypothetical protein